MADKPSFYLDENMEAGVASGVARAGVTVTTARDEDRLGLVDDDQLEFARQAGYVLVTHDRDFERRHWHGEPHAGLLYCPTGMPIGRMVEWIVLASEAMTAEEFRNTFVSAR